jgi:hypothetical protein
MQLIENGWVYASWRCANRNDFSVAVDVKTGIITKTPPVLNKFKGQPIKNLYIWLKSSNLIWIEYKEES